MKKIISILAIIGVFVLAVPFFADATTLTVGNDTTVRTITDTSINFVVIDKNHSSTSSGVLKTFSYYAANTNTFRFVLVDASSKVKWVSDEITPSAVGVGTYTPATPVSVEPDWNLGLYFKTSGTIPFESTGAVAWYTANDSGLPVVGNTLVYGGSTNRIYSFVAIGEVAEMATSVQITWPANNTTITSVAFTHVSWTAVTGTYTPITYQYRSFQDDDYLSPIFTSDWLTTTQISTVGTAEGTYYIQVRAKDAQGNMTGWSNDAEHPYKIIVSNVEPPTIPTTPENKDQCKKGGWKNFVDPSFKNQGQCVSYTNGRTNNHGQYVRSQENKREVAQSRIGMPIQSKGHTK